MDYANLLTKVVFNKYQKPDLFLPTGITTKWVKYRITFIDESFIDVVMTDRQRNYTTQASYASLVKHIGGLGYQNPAQV